MLRPARLLAASRTGLGIEQRDQIWIAAAVMILLQAAFRAWAIYPGYFYGDDFRLIHEARRSDLGLGYLLDPYDAQFMPYGRFIAWIAARPEVADWTLVATTSLLPQVVAAATCLWMLVTLFGWRWGVLGPLALYLSCAMTMPALMWWAAGLNQVPLQAVFFAGVAAWVRYLRGRRLRWLLVALVVLGLGLLCYVKSLLVFPVLGFVALAYFSEGDPVRRVVTAVRAYWPAVMAGVALAVAFTAFYTTQVPQITSGSRPAGAGALADQMLGTSFAVGVFGGPWRWSVDVAPVGRADPPAWAIHLCWTIAALVIAYLALRRVRTGRAWLLLAGYVAADYLLLLITRAEVFGSVTGTEYRYLTDATCALTLAVGLATMTVPGARQASEPRVHPLLALSIGRRAAAVGVALVAVSGTYSAWAYARIWHTEHPGGAYFSTALRSLEDEAALDLADQSVPEDVVAAFAFPYNRTRTLLPLLSTAAQFPESTDRLHVLDDDGRARTADLDVAAESAPAPADGCGWKVTGVPARVPLRSGAIGLEWWLRIDYLASGDSALRVVAGKADVQAQVFRGLGTLYVHVEDGAFDSVTLGGLDPGVTLCVDTIDVGTPAPEGEAP